MLQCSEAGIRCKSRLPILPIMPITPATGAVTPATGAVEPLPGTIAHIAHKLLSVTYA
jgi:hypothetical protein